MANVTLRVVGSDAGKPRANREVLPSCPGLVDVTVALTLMPARLAQKAASHTPLVLRGSWAAWYTT